MKYNNDFNFVDYTRMWSLMISQLLIIILRKLYNEQAISVRIEIEEIVIRARSEI